jgi:DNA primase
MKKSWIDFKALRAKLDFEQVLRHYGVEVKRKGNQHHGYCPLPNHNGKRNSASFSAHLERGIFQCFGCGAKGNVLDFAALMENVGTQAGGGLREVALKLQQRFCPEIADSPTGVKTSNEAKPKAPVKRESEREQSTIVNAPLDFELKGLDAKHPYLQGRGFTSETIEYFGLGFCKRGLLKDRVAIPLHGPDGTLIGYAGRVVDDGAINEDNPRYRFPGVRKRDDTLYEFRKTLFVYNGFRIKSPFDDLIVVEGFTSVWWLHQNGFPFVVATMGADCSEKQAELLVSSVKPDGRLWIVSDGDKAGERHAQALMLLTSPHRFVRWVKLAGGKQPTDLSKERLMTIFTP